MKVSSDVLNILAKAITTDNSLELVGELDRATYVKVDKVIKAMGGKWNKKNKKHLFSVHVPDAIESMMNTGEVLVPQDFGYYPTPKVIVDKMLTIANIQSLDVCLEPSFGKGAILLPMRNLSSQVYGVELLEQNYNSIDDKTGLFNSDFYDFRFFMEFDKIVMNPPFEKKQDVKHILRAYSLLKNGGKLVSIASSSVKYRNDSITVELRNLIATNGYLEDLPEKSFKEAGTNVNTVLIVLEKN